MALGFRPFFVLAGVSAVLLMVPWPWVWRGVLAVPSHYDPVAWHSHEMLFGYAAAVIAGFLLTAVRNWTGVQTWTGWRLGMLAAVWLLGRLLPWAVALPDWLVTAVDVAFLPLVALSLFAPLWQGQQRVNRVFIPLLFGMAAVNLLSHLQLQGIGTALGDARRVMLELILLLIVLVAGRVLPFFTRNVVPGFQPRSRRWVEIGSFVVLGLIVLFEAVPFLPAVLSAALWIGFSGLQSLRLHGWFDPRVFKMPVLWVLHAGYAWMCVGALLQGLASLDLFPPSAALHALTVGTIGVFTLGMMARVSRGHTGRPIDVCAFSTAAFVLANGAVVLRVFGSAWFAERYATWVDLSAVLWVVAFLLFAWRYLPMLIRPRLDGKPG